MREECTIEVTMAAHTWDNKYNPYFWCIKTWDEKTKIWYSLSSGWSKTPNDAWIDANKGYLKL